MQALLLFSYWSLLIFANFCWSFLIFADLCWSLPIFADSDPRSCGCLDIASCQLEKNVQIFSKMDLFTLLLFLYFNFIVITWKLTLSVKKLGAVARFALRVIFFGIKFTPPTFSISSCFHPSLFMFIHFVQSIHFHQFYPISSNTIHCYKFTMIIIFNIPSFK